MPPGVSKTDAHKLQMKLARDATMLAAGIETLAERVTLEDAWQMYLEDRKPQLKHATVRAREATYRLHLRPFFGKVRLDEITAEAVTEWMREAKAKPYKSKGNKVLRTDGTIVKAETVLTTVCKHAAEVRMVFGPGYEVRGWVKPWARVKMPVISHAPKPAVTADADIGRLIRIAKEKGGLERQAAIAISIFAGVRRAELTPLTWHQVNPDRIGHVRFEQLSGEVCRGDEEGATVKILLRRGETKGQGQSRARTQLIYNPQIVRMLWEFQEWQIAEYADAPAYIGSLFPNSRDRYERGVLIRARGEGKAKAVRSEQWNAVRVAAGLPANFVFHALRGSFAKKVGRGQDVSERDIATALGHVGMGSVSRYTREDGSEAVRKTAAVLAQVELDLGDSKPLEPAPYREVANQRRRAIQARHALAKVHAENESGTVTELAARCKQLRDNLQLSQAEVAKVLEAELGGGVNWKNRLSRFEGFATRSTRTWQPRTESEAMAVGRVLARVYGDDSLRFMFAAVYKGQSRKKVAG